MAVKVFLSYAHDDEHLKIALEKHLSLLQRQGLIKIWYDRDISAGKEWEKEIDTNLNKAQIILLLVSPDFVASDYCYSIEMHRAMKLHERGEALVIPVILRPTDWEYTPFSKLQVLPKDYNGPSFLVHPQLSCKGSEYKTRRRNKAKLPRLYIERLMSFKRLICPSTGPVL
jgi:hypothetical protein